MNPNDAERERFDALYRAHSANVHRYVRRHADPGQVEEIVADTFLTAWRRRDRVDHDDPLPWLFVTARRIAANANRRRVNRTDVLDRLERVAAPEASSEAAAVDRAVALGALAALSDSEREAVLLVVWDGLDHARAARAAGCTVRAFTMRLHRARLRLSAQLDAPSDPHEDSPPHQARPCLRLIEESR